MALDEPREYGTIILCFQSLDALEDKQIIKMNCGWLAAVSTQSHCLI